MKIEKIQVFQPRFLFCALMIVALFQPFQIKAQSVEKTKQVARQYTANRPLSIDNKFGKVHVNTNEGDQISVMITFIARANSENRAEEILESLDVEIIEGSAINPLAPISFRTQVEDMNYNNKQFEINYMVSIPKTLKLDLENKFGDIYMADHSGELSLESGYGSLKADHITGNAYIEIKYGSGVITQCKQGAVVVKYSNLNMTSCSDIDLENSFSNTKISEAGHIMLENKYSKLDIGKVNSIEGSSAYSGLKIGSLQDNFVMEVKYNDGLEINQIASGFKNIEIDNQYSNCELQFIPNIAFHFDVNLKYGKFSFDRSRLMINKEIRDDSNCSYSGTCGGSTGGKVLIVSKYGDIAFR